MKHSNDQFDKNMSGRAARAARRRAEQRGMRLTAALCAVLSVALVCTLAVLFNGGGNSPAPDNTAIQAAATPVEKASVSAATAAVTQEASTAAPTPLPTPLDGGLVAPTQSVEPADAGRQTGGEVPVLETEEELTRTTILISAAGDCTLGGDVNSSSGGRFSQYADEYGLDYFFENVRDIFAADDFTVVNLEGPLTTQTSKRSGRQFNFRGDPEYVKILSGSSVEVCSLANNHALDFKNAGLSDTAANLESVGVGAAGYDNAWYGEKDGVRVCFLSFTEWDYSADAIAERVRQEKENSDLVIVSVHWGEELRNRATSTQERYGHAIIDAGADLVLGHHPHVLGGIEQYKGKYIVYSLANFCFGGNSNPNDKDTMIFQQTFVVDGAGNVSDGGINIIPCSISSVSSTNNYQPTPLTGDAAAAVIDKVSSYSTVEEILWMDSYTGRR